MTVFISYKAHFKLATSCWLENNNALQNTNKQSIIATKLVCILTTTSDTANKS